MKPRTLLLSTAIVSSILGSAVAYLVLTVPNDINAAALLRRARKDIGAGNNDEGRKELFVLIQQYPRTDAAAAATVALATIADSERHALQKELEALRRDAAADRKQIAAMQTRIGLLSMAAPAPVQATAPAAASPAATPPLNIAAPSQNPVVHPPVHHKPPSRHRKHR